MLTDQFKLLLTGELFDLRLANAGATAIMARLDHHHFFRAAPTEIFSPGATIFMLGEASFNIGGNTCIQRLVGSANYIDIPLAHPLAAKSYSIALWQYWQRYW